MMANRASLDDDDDPLFVKDGVPVKFCFHDSVTQGRGQITRDVERNGGQIVPNERFANVLLIDEQENLTFFRRRYYSSTELYRLSLYVEPRGFVQTCIRAGTYRHVEAVRQGMPGRARNEAPRVWRARVSFTEEDRDHLAYYLATRCPTRDGRMGRNAYTDLERLGQTEDRSWEWARRHTHHSWREHYKMNSGTMDARIDYYLQRLKDVGHHMGHDPRRRDHERLEVPEVEEEEDEEEDQEEEEQERAIERQTHGRPGRARPVIAGRQPDQAARDGLANHEQDLGVFDDSDRLQEVAIQKPHRVKRHRVHPNPHNQRCFRETQSKRARAPETSTNGRRALDLEASRGEGVAGSKGDSDGGESEESQGSDIFGDRAYDLSRFDSGDGEGASPVPGRDGPPLSTQATLIASPRPAGKEPPLAPMPSKATKATLKLNVPPDPQQMVVTTRERAIAQPARVRGEGYAEEAHISVNMGEVSEDEMAVEGLLEATVEGAGGSEEGVYDQKNEDGDEEEIMSELPRYQDIEVEDIPSDSDDAETHAALVRGVALERSADVGDASEGKPRSDQDQDQDQDQDEDDGGSDDDTDRIKRMANGALYAEPAPVPTLPRPRVTRSRAATRSATTTQQISPRRTRSGNQARAAQQTGSPNLGTKARAVVDRFQEAERRVPPSRTRAAKVGKGRGQRE